jgi:hypothetical protein
MVDMNEIQRKIDSFNIILRRFSDDSENKEAPIN